MSEPGPSQKILPVATGRQVVTHTRRVMASRWREFASVVALYTAAVIAAALVTQSVLIRFGSLAGAKLGEVLLAAFREDFIDGVLALPLSVVEEAGSGDLMTRSSRDVNSLSRTARQGIPAMLTAALTVTLTIGAIAADNPVLVVPCLIVVPPIWAVTRWYLRKAPAGYLREAPRGAC